MNFEDIKKWIEENKDKEEVKAYLQGVFPYTVEGVQKFITENQEAKKWFDSEKDRHFSKGLETWKNNNLEKIINEEIKKRFPEKDPRDIELEKIKAELEKIQREKVLTELKNKAIKVATEKKIPTKLVDYFVAQDEETTMKNLEALESVFNETVEKLVEERLKGSSYIPSTGSNNNIEFTREQIAKMTPEEYAKNKEKIDKLIAQGLLK